MLNSAKMVDLSGPLMRVWERGSGETLALVEGALAAPTAVRTTPRKKGLTHKHSFNRITSRELVDVSWKDNNDSVVMTGGVGYVVYIGNITI